MSDLLLLAFWYSFIITYISTVIELDQYVNRKLDAEIYSEQIKEEVTKLVEEILNES